MINLLKDNQVSTDRPQSPKDYVTVLERVDSSEHLLKTLHALRVSLTSQPIRFLLLSIHL